MASPTALALGAALAGLLAAPAPWSLDDGQRRAFLHHYSPLLLKRADESPRERIGHDWVSNFDFDADGFRLANNGANWQAHLPEFVREGRHAHWQIRPTLYTAIVEFTRGGTKSVVLLYHVYHPMDATHSHDWERIEIRIDGVRGGPGSGERIRYVVLTRHHRNDARVFPHPDLQFQRTPHGDHVLVWQAQQTRRFGPSKGELRFVEDAWPDLEARAERDAQATVEIDGAGEVAFHYAFVDGADPAAVAAWGAEAIAPCNAARLAAGVGPSPVRSREVIGLRYELQDLADLLPDQWHDGPNANWKRPEYAILLASPLRGEDSAVRVPAGLQRFLNGAIDPLFPQAEVRGYLGKSFFWGAYLFDRELGSRSTFLGEAVATGAPRGTRCAANGVADCAGRLWQHDYFVHDGRRSEGGLDDERGEWLPGRWYEVAAGGFDGRWVPLFPDAPPPEARCP